MRTVKLLGFAAPVSCLLLLALYDRAETNGWTDFGPLFATTVAQGSTLEDEVVRRASSYRVREAPEYIAVEIRAERRRPDMTTFFIRYVVAQDAPAGSTERIVIELNNGERLKRKIRIGSASEPSVR